MIGFFFVPRWAAPITSHQSPPLSVLNSTHLCRKTLPQPARNPYNQSSSFLES